MNAIARPSTALAQEQFLDVVSRNEAARRFRAALKPKPLGVERVALAALAGRVLALDVRAPIDTPPFDRSVVDGFALRAEDVAGASEAAPVRLALNPEEIHCGTAPRLAVARGTATPIATGGPLPRGADAVVMIEHTRVDGGALVVTRPLGAGRNIAYAGSDVARGETILRAGTPVSAREIGLLAAVGLADAPVWRRPRVAVLSTGDELTPQGAPLAPAAIYDSNGPIIAAAVEENGGLAVRLGAIPDDEARLRAAIRAAHADCDMVILSGGTSKGAGDLTHRLVAELGAPGIVVHGVALKPGKPLCLAVCGGKPVVVLPGFPTSAMFTFHDIVAPVLRLVAGLPERVETDVPATLATRVASEIGRTEYVMVMLVDGPEGARAFPVGKGSGAVSAFSQADGFVAVDALADGLPAGAPVSVRLLAKGAAAPDLIVAGSHCHGLDAVFAGLFARGVSARSIALGSLGGLAALTRGECDLAPIHLLDPESGTYNTPFLPPGTRLVPGWKRMQGVVFRRGDARFEGRAIEDAVAAALADPDCVLVSRNAGSGTRVLIDRLLAGAKPPGASNEPRSHDAVGAAIAQGRADWGVAIRPVAEALGLGFLAIAEEHYDFALREDGFAKPAVAAFLVALEESADALAALGFRRA
jgi:putative molybdopterin biosynthesis protein